jgi:hypothetical protein
MGSRINVLLSDLLHIPNIKINLAAKELSDGEDSTVIPTAEVTFKRIIRQEIQDVIVYFDYSNNQGKIELSADFNWFRYPNDPEHMSRLLLLMLYENSISFTVNH